MGRNKFCGVYCIRCIVNNKVYVGGSQFIQHRWLFHKQHLRKNNHVNSYLQEDWNVHGKDKFIFSILEICTSDVLNLKEQYWINTLRSTETMFGYNIMMPLENYKPREGFNLHKIVPHKCNIMVCIHKDYIIEYGDITYFRTKYKLVQDKVYSCLQYWNNWTKQTNKSYKGLIFVWEHDYNPDFDYINYKRPMKVRPPKIKREPIPYKDRNFKRTKVLTQNVSTGEELIFNSIAECIEKLNLLKSKIPLVINKPWKQRSHHGYYLKRLE